MTWLDALDISIMDALSRFPDEVQIASFNQGHHQTFMVSRQSLEDMVQMQLGHLPISSVALPYHLSEMLTRITREKLIRDVSHHLTDFFPNFFVAAIYELQSLFAHQGVEAFIIGGITRDMLLSGERRFDIQDVDIIIEGNAIAAAHTVDSASKNFNFLQEFQTFGTAKLDYKGQIEIDFASTRHEIYPSCGHLPQIVQLGVPLQQDIIRRDFTINALALSITNPGQVIDCIGGLKDLESKVIRLLKPHSFYEDPSRILRAIRFAAMLEFHWAEDIDFLLQRFLLDMPIIYKGGGDRIREELYKLFALPQSPAKYQWLTIFIEKGLHRLIDTQLPSKLDLPLPFAAFFDRLSILQQQCASFWTPQLTWEILLSFLFLGLPQSHTQAAMHRLGLTRHEIEVIEKVFRLLDENIVCPITPDATVFQLYEIFHPLPIATACTGILLSPHFQSCLAAYLKYKIQLEPIKLEVSGNDILKLGVPQGEQVGYLLKSLLYAKLEGQVSNRHEEIQWLKNHIQPGKSLNTPMHPNP